MRRPAAIGLLVSTLIMAGTTWARDGLGIWNDWGAFRDPGVPRCYAIAMPLPVPGRASEFQAFATVGVWPKRGVRGAFHARLSRQLEAGRPVRLTFGRQDFALVGGAADVWGGDLRTDAAIIAALRSAGTMTIIAHGSNGTLVRDTYRLAGAASAIDAALLGCAGR